MKNFLQKTFALFAVLILSLFVFSSQGVFAAVQGKVIVKHYDKDDGTQEDLWDLVEIKGESGTPYTTHPEDISGYTLHTIPLNANGVFTDADIIVIYLYEKTGTSIDNDENKTQVIVKHVDSYAQKLADDETIEFEMIGAGYTTQPKVIEGYKVHTPDNYKGVTTKEPIIVIYVYKKEIVGVSAEIVVKYVDKENNHLLDVKTLEGNVGEEYTTPALEFDGYVLIETPGNANGKFKDEKIEVVYVYKKLEPKVTVEGGTADNPYAEEGKTVKVTAKVPAGKKFVNWTGEDVTFTDANSATTTFTMPAKNVKVTANFETDTSAPETPIVVPATPSSGTSSSGWSGGARSNLYKAVKTSANTDVELRNAKIALGEKTKILDDLAKILLKKDRVTQKKVKALLGVFKKSADAYTRNVGIYLASVIK